MYLHNTTFNYVILDTIDLDSGTRRIHKNMTAATNPVNHDFTTSSLITGLSICRKTASHIKSQFGTDQSHL